VPVASHADDELRQRVSQASHDLGNLLGVVLNYATLLARQLSDPTALADIDQIKAAATRAADIAHTLMTSERDAARLGDA
jgi:light-regulated signal transduction histidine kinase (bacteriophytochrome)